MRILIDSSNYFIDNDNNGDRAIFQVIGKRLSALWPEAQIRFITLNPQRIQATHPKLSPFFIGNCHQREIFHALEKAYASLSGMRQTLRQIVPRRFASQMMTGFRQRAKQCMPDAPELEDYFQAVCGADLLFATGGGYYSDAFPRHAQGILDTLEGGIQLGKPAVMMGAGFETVRDAGLLAKAKSVLPRLSLIACREKLTGPAYLQSLGVRPRRIVVTGDDAVELAYDKRAAALGSGIGINLRQAEYAGVDDSPVDILQSVLHTAARQYAAPLLPIPISLYGPSDVESIRKLLAGFDDQSDGGKTLDTPHKVLDQVRQCRIVVTGSYHAGLFALSQGISVVGMVRSLHYITKMQGLTAQFKGGCAVVSLDDPNLRETLTQAINTAWEKAEQQRPGLLQAAQDQIEAGQAAYRRIYRLVNWGY